jgi:nitroimidazol reductase NimA-like FMN-containing flavoprotein (pyridoxamine 5'-phosphate oxidase superfamily)
MLFFGPASSVFDSITFGVMPWGFHAGPALFRSGWFVESLAIHTLVIFAIRTRRIPFFRSRPSVPLLLAALAVTRSRCPRPGLGSDAASITHSRAEREMSRFPADHSGLEILPHDECLRLLGTVPVGRVSFFADGEIVVLPVNHVMDGNDPVFRTTRGSKLSAAEGQDVVAFEADAYDERTRTGWSVLVNGRAYAIYEDPDIRRLSRLGLQPWAAAAKHAFWIRIRPASITGRRTPEPDDGLRPGP